ncbi:hypothetical protein [Arundinibacter roseus]|uniref:Uncharacterized protein n=1 Tax=Arundinibacter roseus TaxID=2070510 RepID=A0A4R4JWD1_9BACT|nr:hypothetical protein [Arundinibacter roseus]TDB58221.1 hypothetical protein EZE20_23160 [Arundinibacter roseus]
MKKLVRGFFYIFTAGIAVSCYDCGPQAEPTITLSLRQDTLQTIQRISALDAKSDSAFSTLDPGSYYGTATLPVSLLQDSTTFLLYAENRVDTLTLFYKRIFDSKRECGYYVDLSAPEAGPPFKTTLNQPVQVEYSSYLGPRDFKGPSPLGIRITIGRY